MTLMVNNILGNFFWFPSDFSNVTKLKAIATPIGRNASVSIGNAEKRIAKTVKTMVRHE